MKKIIYFILLVFSYSVVSPQKSESEPEYLLKEWNTYFKGVYKLPSDSTNAVGIMNELKKHSGMLFSIFYAREFRWGHAHNGNVILIDFALLNKPIVVLAYYLAHEWGHIALGHPENLCNSNGNSWKFLKLSLDEEYSADFYAGEFMAKNGYNLPVLNDFFVKLPATSKWNSHQSTNNISSGLLNGYTNAKKELDDTTNEYILKNKKQYRKTEIKCIHLSHPSGDAFPCSHVCYDKLTGLTLPCHPNGDVTDCTHFLHPEGD